MRRSRRHRLCRGVELSGTIGVFSICNGYRDNTCQPSYVAVITSGVGVLDRSVCFIVLAV